MKRLITSVFLILMVVSAYALTSNASAVLHNITASVCDGTIGTGTISPSGPQAVEHNGNISFFFTPASGYEIDEILVDGNPVTTISNPYTFNDVIEDHTICVRFKIKTFTINATAEANGTITPSGILTYNYGDPAIFTIEAATDFEIATLTVDGAPYTLPTPVPNPYSFEEWNGGVTANHAIHVTFSAIVYDTFEVSYEARHYPENDGAKGEVTPTNPQRRRAGESVSFNVSTDHIIDTITIDDNLVYAWDADETTIMKDTTLEFNNLDADHSFDVVFLHNTGITEVKMPTLAVNPNPTTGKINVEYGNNIINKMEIINAMGNVIMTIENPNNSLDITSIPTGTYFLRFYTDKNFTSRKIVKN